MKKLMLKSWVRWGCTEGLNTFDELADKITDTLPMLLNG